MKRKLKIKYLIIILLVLILLITTIFFVKKQINKTNEPAKVDKDDLRKYAGEFDILFNDENEILKGLSFKKKIKTKICDNKKSTDCIDLKGDNKFLVLGTKESNYIAIPVKYLVNKDKSELDSCKDEYESVICFKRTEYALDQIMCPPEDSEAYKKEDLSIEYSFKLYAK